ncbi:UPF0481 protein At3g47200-like [Aristolochia californica]|uniref:UPF0481 protein At3g47200-like n=1 Tax=Aristolochia californica TaxID=171875 RepID=UPI0035E009C4
MDSSESASSSFFPSSLSLFNIRSRVSVTLRSSNYLQWKTQFLPFLKSQSLLGFIDGSVEAPPVTIKDETGGETSNPEYLNWFQTDQLILSWINATLAEESLCHVVGLTTALETWKELEDVYNLQQMEGEFEATQHPPGHTVARKAKGQTGSVKNNEIAKAAWKDSVRQKLNSLNDIDRSTASCTIFRVPPRIRIFDDAAYEPQIVSIGPYHRGKKQLQSMEKYKWQYLHNFLSRKGVMSLDGFLDEMQTLEKDARNRYSKDVSLDCSEFLEMMVLDGCFVVEFFLKFTESTLGSLSPDPILDSRLIWDSVGHDLLLVENQLPLFVISHIFDTYNPSNPSLIPLPLDKLALNFFHRMADFIITGTEPLPAMESIHHLLHLVYINLIPPLPQLSTQSHNSVLAKLKSFLFPNPSISSQPIWNIPSVQGLQEAGVKIRKGKGENFLDIKFSKGVMEIPYVDIDDFTNTFLRNMIAYEQIHRPERLCFSLYTLFMDDLINTTKDVDELTKKGIIENSLGSDEDVTVLFNQMGKGTIVSWDDHSLELTEEINRYCSTKRNIWRAKLVHDYFSNPWAFISLIGALLLLLLTLLQTLFSILPYAQPRN